MFYCKYCNKEFESKYKLAGHSTFCKENPNINKNLQRLEENRKHIQYRQYIYQKFNCQYCNKEVGNKGCLARHEKSCIKNPNAILSKTAQKIKDIQYRKEHNIKIIHKHSEESKRNLSEKRKLWLVQHKDEHVWKRNTKFVSQPCENFKNFLRSKNIIFVEEYSPFDDVNYSLDIAWPDEKIAIEINGNQHYNKDGSLTQYYQERHDLFENRGWKIFEIHYTKCYNININDFQDILNLPIYDKDYVNKYFSRKEQNKIIKRKTQEKTKRIRKDKSEKQEKRHQENKEILLDLFNNSNIDFSKMGWSSKAKDYLKANNVIWYKKIFGYIRHYFPEFLKQENVWKRKGSIY